MLPTASTRSRKKKDKKPKQQQEEKKVLSADEAILKVQCLVRRYLARRRMRSQAQVALVRVFDPTFKRYFWFNQFTKTSTWKKPKFTDMFTEVDFHAIALLQRLIRGYIGRRRAQKLANERYIRYFDNETGRFYWYDKKTNQTTYNTSSWLKRMNIELPVEDKLLHQSYMKIKELEQKLQEKEQEIKVIRKQRYEELEPQVIQDKVKSVKNLQRSKYMDEWTIDDLAAWFTELKMEEYLPNLFSNRVDGHLFINLNEEEFRALGIVNKFHLRKLQLILKSYRIYHQRKLDRKAQGLTAGEYDDEDEDLISEYSPSELSAILAAEDAQADHMSDGDDSFEDNRSFASEENEEVKLTEEQKLQRRMDLENIQIELMMAGDGHNFPMIGDIVRVRYVCYLTETGKEVMSTKHTLERPWVEFVIGIDQVIKGFDRAIPMMSVGERSKITMSPEYAYADTGLLPHIPPNAKLTFDLTLLGFRARTTWVKPLLQDIKTNEFPYEQDLKGTLALDRKSGMDKTPLLIYSPSLLLNDDDAAASIGKVTTKLT